MTSPLDELNVQLPGRIMALELMVTLLLREKSQPRRLIAQAEDQLARLEANEIGAGMSSYALQVYAAARETLDMFARNTQK
jgi:hypothetical protein